MATTATAPTRDPALVASIEQRNNTFSTLLRLIPQQYYVAATEEELDSRWMKNKKRKTGDEIKEHKRRVKQDKLDPSNLPGADVKMVEEASTSSALPPALPALSALPPAASITDLRDRMRAKLDGYKRARGIDDNEDPQSRDALEAARRQRRGEIRDKRRKERKEERKKARVEVTAKTAKTQLLVPNLPKPDDSISFPSVALPSATKRSGAPLKKLSNPSQALAHLEKHNAKLASLPEEKRREIEEKERWAKAEERAAGGKVADQVKVLKNAVKREEKRKGKSGKEWVERKKTVDKSTAMAIKKRNDNINSRLDARRNKRLGIKDKTKAAAGKGGKKDHKSRGDRGDKGDKKGRPGFEGKSGTDKKKRAAQRA